MAAKQKPQPKFCELCGAEFDGHKNAKYCSDECRRKRQNELNILRYQQQKEREIAKKQNTGGTDWSAIVRKCRELNMSYGEVVKRGLI